MGVFDYLTVEHPLPSDPLPPPNGALFQTKDTAAQDLERYTITADGRLIHHTVRYEQTPAHRLPFPDMPAIGSVQSIPSGDVEVRFHGDIAFHAAGAGGAWWSYVARFTEGRCVRIWCAEHRKPGAPSDGRTPPATHERGRRDP